MADPYSYYEAARAKGPLWREPHHGAFMVTGYEEICEISRDPLTFSSCNAFAGPFVDIPENPADPDDFAALIDKYRHTFAFSENLITFDPPLHTAHRGLMMRLLTPRRLEENEEFMRRTCDSLIDSFAGNGAVEFAAQYAQPFSLLVIADLLGIPEQDHQALRQKMVDNGPAGRLGQRHQGNFLGFLEDVFSAYIEQRRREPRDDVLTAMAQARFPDGSLPDAVDAVRVATILFAGGQGTSARFQVSMMRLLAEDPQLQQQLREDRSLVSNFVEEALRFASPTKVNFRLARVSTDVAGIHVPAGSTLVLLLGAADRDGRRFDCPAQFEADRSNAGTHLAFGRGRHSCPGGPLVRSEARITLGRILDRLGDFTIAEAHHGPAGDRRYDRTPSYIIHGVEELHLSFTRRQLAL